MFLIPLHLYGYNAIYTCTMYSVQKKVKKKKKNYSVDSFMFVGMNFCELNKYKSFRDM